MQASLLLRDRSIGETSLWHRLVSWWTAKTNPYTATTRRTTAMLPGGVVAHVRLERRPGQPVEAFAVKCVKDGRRIRVTDHHRILVSRMGYDLWQSAWDDMTG